MAINQQTQQEEMQDAINARLAQISKAVEEKLAGVQQGVSVGEEAAMLTTSTCPIDPMERLLCEGCQ